MWLQETPPSAFGAPDSERLRSLARARQIPVIDVLPAALDALERQEFLRGLGQD